MIYSTRGVVKWLIKHGLKPSALSDTRSHPSAIKHDEPILSIQVSKNIFNKNDSNVGLLRTVKKVWIQEEHNEQ